MAAYEVLAADVDAQTIQAVSFGVLKMMWSWLTLTFTQTIVNLSLYIILRLYCSLYNYAAQVSDILSTIAVV